MSRTAVLLAAHGSRRDPAANALVERYAATLRASRVADEVVVGFHHGPPGLTEALDSLQADRVVVLPLFTSEGYYVTDVLPAALNRARRAQHITLRQAPPLGIDSRLPGVVAARVQRAAQEHGLSLDRTSLLVVGHGTRRHPRSRDATLHLAGRLAQGGIAAEVHAAFLDDQPDVPTALAALSQESVLVVPFLIGGSFHVAADLPRLLGLGHNESVATTKGGRRIVLDIPVGTYPEIGDLLEEIARAELPSVAPTGSLAPGSVALVGAGPGDPGLITVRGLALLRAADVILHDRLVATELLAEARRDALIIDVGKTPGGGESQTTINALLIEHAAAGRRVVRLKGGDPFVFGRGSEEHDACLAAGIPCSVVSGVTSAVAVPAAAGIPVTARGEARSFAVVTAQIEGGGVPGAVEALAVNAGVDTLVLLMGRSALREVAAAALAAGRDPATAAACVANGTTPSQRVTVATLATIADAADRDGLESPVVTIIGPVAARAAALEPTC